MISTYFKKVVKEKCEKVAFQYLPETQANGKKGKL